MDKCTIDLFSFTTILSNQKNYKNYTVRRLMWPLQIFLLLIFLSFFVEVSPAHRLQTINIHTIQIHMSSWNTNHISNNQLRINVVVSVFPTFTVNGEIFFLLTVIVIATVTLNYTTILIHRQSGQQNRSKNFV